MNRKPLLLIILVFLSVASVMFPPALAYDYTDISVLGARAMIDANTSLIVLDVRNQSEYDSGHIRNAKLIPLDELAARLNELNKTNEILVYGGEGESSANASQLLASDGFLHVYNMPDGITTWVQEGFPVYIKYASVQEAINNASVGDTIYVSAGVYTEPLVIDKSIVLEGENRYTAIIDAATNTTIYVMADNVSISDFTLKYSGGCACYDTSAVNVTGSRNTNITNNEIVSDDHGVQADDVTRLTIAYNNITCPNNTFIVILNSSEISLSGNSVVAADGMELDNCAESVFSDNTVSTVMGAPIFAYQSNQNTFSGNEIIADISAAISISDCYNNTFLGNNFSSNAPNYGLFFWQSYNNSFLHNNFLENSGRLTTYRNSYASWDNGFEGNYWSNYTGADTDLNGIGDTPNILDSVNTDNFPLKGMFRSFNTTLDYEVEVISNSAVEQLEYVEPDRTIKLQVSNTTANQSVGFCRISVPHSLIDPYNSSISVVIDDGLTPVLFFNNTLYDNGTHRWIYFMYAHSTHEIIIVPEFSSFLILTLFAATTVAAVATHRRRRSLAGARKMD